MVQPTARLVEPGADADDDPTSYSIGTVGLKQWDGRIHEEFLRRLRGQKGYETIREMVDNSSVVGTIQVVIDRLVRQVEWSTKPSDEKDPVAVQQAEFVESCRDDMSASWNEFISEAFSFLPFGWSYHEICYKQRRGSAPGGLNSKHSDGLFGWRKLAPRGQDTLERWEFDDNDSLRGLHQRDYNSGACYFVPIEKALLFRTQVIKGNPEGKSIYRSAIVDYFFLKRIQELEAIGFEKDMGGVAVMQVPVQMLSNNATPAEKSLVDALERMIYSLKRGEREGAIVPSELDREGKPTGFKFELLAAGGARQFNTVEIKRDYRVAILQTALAQFLQLGQAGASGNRALSVSSIDIFAVALKTYVDEVASVLTRHAVPRLLRLNNMDLTKTPIITHGDVVAPSLDDLVKIVLSLSQAQQLMPDSREITNAILERASLPTIEDAPSAAPSAEAQAMIDALGGTAPSATSALPPASETLAASVLNGAQISSVLEILQITAAGQVPRETALGLIQAAGLSAEAAEKMVGDIGRGFQPTAPAITPPKSAGTAAPVAEGVADGADDGAQALARLNGAQIQAMLQILRAVAAGEIPRANAVAFARSLGLTEADAENLIGIVGQ
jgi:hypothetical protein